MHLLENLSAGLKAVKRPRSRLRTGFPGLSVFGLEAGPEDAVGGEAVLVGRHAALKRHLITFAKFAISAAIIAWLVVNAYRDAGEKDLDLFAASTRWGLVALAWLAFLANLILTIIRWHLLVVALDIPFRLRDAFRLGFLGYLFNFVSLGSVGGDVFRAIFIARETPKHRAEAVATVLIDRIIGLYVLFVMASCCIVYKQLWSSDATETRIIANTTLIATVIGFIGIVVLLVPGFTTGALSEALGRLPRIGPTVSKLIWAVRIYRRKLGVILVASLLTLGVHSLSTLGIYALAIGLEGEAPSLGAHFIIVPLSMVAGALPLPMMGLGAFEFALELLYQQVPSVVKLSKIGVLKVAFWYRMITILNAAIGAVYYLAARREVAEVWHEATEVGPVRDVEKYLDEPDGGPVGQGSP